MVDGAARQQVVGVAVGGGGGGGHFCMCMSMNFVWGLWDAILNLTNC